MWVGLGTKVGVVCGVVQCCAMAVYQTRKRFLCGVVEGMIIT